MLQAAVCQGMLAARHRAGQVQRPSSSGFHNRDYVQSNATEHPGAHAAPVRGRIKNWGGEAMAFIHPLSGGNATLELAAALSSKPMAASSSILR